MFNTSTSQLSSSKFCGIVSNRKANVTKMEIYLLDAALLEYFSQQELDAFSTELKHFLNYAIGIGITIKKNIHDTERKINQFVSMVRDHLNLIATAQDIHIHCDIDDKYDSEYIQDRIYDEKERNGEISYIRPNYSYGY